MKKLTALWLSLLLAFGTLTGCAGQIGIIGGEDGPTAIITSDSASAVSVTEDGQYDSKDEVSAYLTEYGHLPSNYITKKQAQALGWQGGLARAVCTRLLDRRRPVRQLRGHPAGRQLSRVRPQHPRSRQARRGTAGLRGRRPNLLHRRPLREF